MLNLCRCPGTLPPTTDGRVVSVTSAVAVGSWYLYRSSLPATRMAPSIEFAGNKNGSIDEAYRQQKWIHRLSLLATRMDPSIELAGNKNGSIDWTYRLQEWFYRLSLPATRMAPSIELSGNKNGSIDWAYPPPHSSNLTPLFWAYRQHQYGGSSCHPRWLSKCYTLIVSWFSSAAHCGRLLAVSLP